MNWRHVFLFHINFKKITTLVRNLFLKQKQNLYHYFGLENSSIHQETIQNFLNLHDATAALHHMSIAQQQNIKIPRRLNFAALCANGRVTEAYASYRSRKISKLLKKTLGSRYVNDLAELMRRSNSSQQKILILASDGPGDEVHFGCYYQYLVLLFGQSIAFTCDPRLTVMMQATFPDNHFIPVNRLHRYWEPTNSEKLRGARLLPKLRLYCALDDTVWKQLHEYDSVCLMLDLLSDLTSKYGFKKIGSYLNAPPEVAHDFWRKWKLSNYFTVGLSWRSTFLNQRRLTEHFSVHDCKVLLDLSNVKFVILQAKLSIGEREWLLEHFGDRVIIDDDLDVFDNLSELASVISRLDFVVSTGNYVVELAAALGRPTALLSNNPSHRYRRDPTTKIDLTFPSLLHCEGDRVSDKEMIFRTAESYLTDTQVRKQKNSL